MSEDNIAAFPHVDLPTTVSEGSPPIPTATLTRHVSARSVGVKIQLLDPQAQAPELATAGSAGVDLRTLGSFTLDPGETRLVGTGLRVAIPEGFALFLLPRSGLGHKHGVVLGNLVGLIDSDYRGELFVSLWNRSDEAYFVAEGERIAQAVILPVYQPYFEVVEDLDETERGDGGFGHTGGV